MSEFLMFIDRQFLMFMIKDKKIDDYRLELCYYVIRWLELDLLLELLELNAVEVTLFLYLLELLRVA